MARPLRVEFPFAVYHVTSRGNARADIFLDDIDRRTFLDILGIVLLRYNWLCHAFCLMGNHYHLIIETPDANLSQGMRQLNGTYSQTFNRRHGRVGHIFQSRFRAVVVQKDSHLLELSRYVVLNPVRAGMVATPEQWPWSSYLPMLEGPGASKVLTSQWMLSQFGGTTSEALKKYRDFVLKEDPQDRSPWWRVNGEVVFGTEEFATKIHALVGAKEETPEIPSLQRHVGRPALEVLFPKGRTAPRGERNCAIGDAHLKYGYGLKQIADHIGMHYTSISKVIKTLLVKK